MLSFSKVGNSFGFVVIQILIGYVLTFVSWLLILFIIVLDDLIWAGLIFLCRKFWHRLIQTEKNEKFWLKMILYLCIKMIIDKKVHAHRSIINFTQKLLLLKVILDISFIFPLCNNNIIINSAQVHYNQVYSYVRPTACLSHSVTFECNTDYSYKLYQNKFVYVQLSNSC